MGMAILPKQSRFFGVHIFLLLVVLSSIFNIIENTQLRDVVALITPIFVIGFAPAFYICAKFLINGHQNKRILIHFLPMLMALPFAHFVQEIIAIGTVIRAVYTVLTILMILRANEKLAHWRSDVADVSLTWFAWLVGLSTVINALDLLRLNYQIELGMELNMGLHITTSIFSTVLLAGMIVVLNRESNALNSINEQPESEPPTKQDTESDFQAIFDNIDGAVKDNEWFCQPRLTLADLGQKTGWQTRDISRAINIVHGDSFNDYINQLRVEKVKSLLQTSKTRSLLDIGLAAGFSSKASFNTVFKKHMNATPGQYRKSLSSES